MPEALPFDAFRFQLPAGICQVLEDFMGTHRLFPIQRRTAIAVLSVLLAMAEAISGIHGHAQDKTIVIDGQSTGRIFDGLGAVSAGASTRLLVDYPEPQRSQILDYLFKPSYGAALQHLKVEVGGDVNSTDGSEPSHMRARNDHDYTRGYEWWLMEEAYKRNPNIILDILPWGAPGWIGNGKLYSPDMAEYMAEFIEAARDKYGLKINYAGIWNETVHDDAYVKQLHEAFLRHHLDTKIVCCDLWPGEGKGQWSIADEMQSDPALKAAVDAIGVHYPKDKGKCTTTDVARNSGKPLWASEDQPNNGAFPLVQRTWPIGGRMLAHLYNQNYLEGAMTKTEIWSPITSYYDILAAPNSGLMYANTPWSGFYDIQPTIWVTAHTTQFAQPGWHYLDSSSSNLPATGTYVTLRSPNGKDWSTVLETIDATQTQQITFTIKGGLASGPVHIWETNATRIFEHVADLTPKNGAFSFAFDPESIYSITTTTGQGKGNAQPPSPKPFPMPYSEDFESTPLSRAPRYLSDQDGAFEVHPCAGRDGRCLEQVITEKPIPWGPLPDPFTLAGDVDWTDYTVAADFAIRPSGAVTLMGRIDSADVFQGDKVIYPSGYILSVQTDGAWKLVSAAYKKPTVTLASGSAAILPGEWHRFALTFHGNVISALLDGKQLANIGDNSHTHGVVALGTGWNKAQFDKLTVTQ
jgi:hypothetical protein